MSAFLAARGSAEVIKFTGRQVRAGFTCRDLMELTEWDGAGRRIEVDPHTTELGQFALIYEGAQPWASWAISREGAQILLWDCITLVDIGRFACIGEALAAVPGGTAEPASKKPEGAAVIPFRAPLARRPAA